MNDEVRLTKEEWHQLMRNEAIITKIQRALIGVRIKETWVYYRILDEIRMVLDANLLCEVDE